MYQNPHKRDLLRQLKERRISAPELYELYSKGRLDQVTSVTSVITLTPHMVEWVSGPDHGGSVDVGNGQHPPPLKLPQVEFNKKG